MGRNYFWPPLYWSDSHFTGCSGKKRYQRAAGDCASSEPHGGEGGRGVDCDSVCINVEPFDCGDWIGVDGWLGAHSVRCRTRFVHAVMAWQGASAIWNSL